MAVELPLVIAAPARTSAPTAPKVDHASAGTGAPSGKRAPDGGESLPAAPPAPTVADAHIAAAKLNELLSKNQRSLRFEVDEASGRTVITVINPMTQEIVRQIPPEEVLAIARAFDLRSSLIDVRI